MDYITGHKSQVRSYTTRSNRLAICDIKKLAGTETKPKKRPALFKKGQGYELPQSQDVDDKIRQKLKSETERHAHDTRKVIEQTEKNAETAIKMLESYKFRTSESLKRRYRRAGSSKRA